MSSAWNTTENAIATVVIIAMNRFHVSSPPKSLIRSTDGDNRRAFGVDSARASSTGASAEFPVNDIGSPYAGLLLPALCRILSPPCPLLSISVSDGEMKEEMGIWWSLVMMAWDEIVSCKECGKVRSRWSARRQSIW